MMQTNFAMALVATRWTRQAERNFAAQAKADIEALHSGPWVDAPWVNLVSVTSLMDLQPISWRSFICHWLYHMIQLIRDSILKHV